jgi:hypothetical protein
MSSTHFPPVSENFSLNSSLSKRPSSAPSMDESSLKKIKITDTRIDRIRNTRLVSFPIRELSVGTYPTRAERLAAAIRGAAEFDNDRYLPENTSHVNLRTEPPSSQSEVYEHSNDHSWENVALLVGGIKSQVRLGFRCFLDCLYAECGYIPVWEQNRHPTHVPQYPSRAEAVYQSMDKLREYGIGESQIVFLVGKKSLYKENQSYVHDLPICVVGACMSKFSRSVNDARRDVYRLAWKFLTGLDSFVVDREDNRWLGIDGVTQKEDLANEEVVEFDNMEVFGWE